ncbi:hypothetical protein GCM10009557_25440 [Virgisporangium ochraceum]|uniref:Uncharacterized protein n=2 Tax=Virgisporangium ochraceum TaxID=65505 RepID=A0A8J4E9B1_9ACTN|nr:hypothetical protein Voc01_014830 [Virgisporangium ochraceum]
MLKRTKLAITGAVAAGVVGAGAIAYAAFGYTPTASGSGSAESFKPTKVTVSDTPSLLPGEKDNVNLVLSNPNKKIKAKVESIKPAGISDVKTNDPNDADQCGKWVIQTVENNANAELPTLGEGDAKYTLVEGIAFSDDMDIRCEGMTFKSNWTVEFVAVRK